MKLKTKLQCYILNKLDLEEGQLWDENIALRDELADARLHAMDAHDALQSAFEVMPYLPLKNADTGEEICQKGFKQFLERASKNAARIITNEEK